VAAYAQSGDISLKELSISLFLFITAPVSAHLIAKAAIAAKAAGRDGD
jgi:multicomponent K+:H+ antiporter subunit G